MLFHLLCQLFRAQEIERKRASFFAAGAPSGHLSDTQRSGHPHLHMYAAELRANISGKPSKTSESPLRRHTLHSVKKRTHLVRALLFVSERGGTHMLEQPASLGCVRCWVDTIFFVVFCQDIHRMRREICTTGFGWLKCSPRDTPSSRSSGCVFSASL